MRSTDTVTRDALPCQEVGGRGSLNIGQRVPGQYSRFMEKVCQGGKKSKEKPLDLRSLGYFLKENKKAVKKCHNQLFFLTLNDQYGIKPSVMFFRSLDKAAFPWLSLITQEPVLLGPNLHSSAYQLRGLLIPWVFNSSLEMRWSRNWVQLGPTQPESVICQSRLVNYLH